MRLTRATWVGAVLACAVAMSGCASAAEPTAGDAASESRAAPNVVGLTESGACSVIEREGFRTGRITTETAEADTDPKVLSQDPAAGTMLDSGATIDMVVAVPAQASEVKVPDLAGGKRA